MAKFVDPKAYAKNLLKSAKYISVEAVKGINPDFYEYVNENGSTVKDLFKNAKGYKTDLKGKAIDMIGEDGIKAIKSVKGNVISDIRSGKFYNEERLDQSYERSAKSMGFDFDFDFDEEDDDGKDNAFSEEISEERKTTKAVLSIGQEISMSQAKAADLSSMRIAKTSNLNTKAMMAQNEYLFGSVNNNLSLVHSSILSFHNSIAEPLNAHIQNSTSFYTSTTTELGKQTKILENIYSLIEPRYKAFNSNSKGISGNGNKQTAWEKVVGYSGLPSLSAYADIVKSRTKNNPYLGLLSSLGGDSIGMAIDSAAASPISFALTYLLKNKLSKGPSARALDRTLDIFKGGFANISSKIHRSATKDSGILGTIARLFDIAPTSKAKINLSNYNKGPQDWTGMDSKALRDVIPTQLSSILAAITGKPAKIFDYKSGRFVTAKSLVTAFKKEREQQIGSSSRGLKDSIINEFIKEDNALHENDNTPAYTRNSRAVRNLSKDYDTLMSLFTVKNINLGDLKGVGSIVNICESQGWFKSGLLNKNNIETLDRLIFKKNASIGKLISASYSGKLANSRFMSEVGNTSFANIANGSGVATSNNKNTSIGSRLFNEMDKYGNSVFNYLQDYYKQLRTIANNTAGVSKRGAGYKGGKVNTSSLYQLQDTTLTEREFNTPATISQSSFSSSEEDPEGRQVYNEFTGSYEDAKERKFSVSSRFSREKAEKTSPLSRAIDKVNSHLDRLFFGDSVGSLKDYYNEHNGLLGIIKDMPKSLSEAIPQAIDKLKEKAKNTWTKFKESEWGQDFIGATKGMIKNHFKETLNYGKAKAADAYRFLSNGKAAPWEADLTGAYKGGMVSKSGMASVSEGEMIIPAKYNPYYKGNMSDGQRKAVEDKNYKSWLKDGGDDNDFFGFFRKGSKNVTAPNNKWTKLTEDDKNTINKMSSEGNTPEEIAKTIKRPIKQVEQYITSLNVKGTSDIIKEDIGDKVNKIKGSDTVKKISSVLNQASTRIDQGLDMIFGKDRADNIRYTTDEIKDTVKKNAPKTAASGLLGGLIGAAATGSGLGLVGGMAIGAGINILKNSESLSTSLFGTYDGVNDKWVGGKLPDKVTKFIKNKMPKMAKSGTIGSILGTLGVIPGGIFGGFAIGAGLELVSTTDTFKDIMFGHEGIDGKRHGGIMGSLKLRIIDPLANFVKDGISNIGDFFKKNFYAPIKGMFNPIKDWIKGKGLKIANSLGEGLKNKIGLAADKLVRRFDFILNPISKAAKGVGKKAVGLVKGVASAPGKALKNMAFDLTAHNIRKGYTSMNAQERMKLEGKKYGFGALRTVKNSAYTKWAATASDADIRDASYIMNGGASFKKANATKRLQLSRLIVASLNNGGAGNPKVVKRIQTLLSTSKLIIDNNDYSELTEYINSLDESVIGENAKAQVLKKIRECQKDIQHNMDRFSNIEEDKTKFFNKIGITNQEDIKKFIKHGRLQSKIDVMGLDKKDKEKEEQEVLAAQKQDDIAKKLKEQEEEDPMGAKQVRTLSGIKTLLSGIAVKLGVEPKDIPKFKEDDKQSYNEIKTKISSTITKNNNSAKFDQDGEAAPGTRETQKDASGNTVEYVYNNGEWTPDMADASTNKAIKNAEEDRQIKNDFYKGGFLSKLKGLFGLNNEKEEEKTSLLDKLGGLFGLLGKGISSKIGLLSSSIKGIVPTLLKSLPSILASVATLGVASALGEKTAGTGTDSGMYKGADAESRKEEVSNMGFLTKAGLGFDSAENTIRGRDTTTFEKDDYTSEYMTEAFGKGLGKNALLSFNKGYRDASSKILKVAGKIPVVGLGLKASMLPGKAANKLLNGKDFKVSDKITNVANKVSGAVNNIKGKASTASDKILSKLYDSKVGKQAMGLDDAIYKVKKKVAPVLKALATKLGLNAADDVLDNAAEEIAGQMGKKAGTKLVKLLAKMSIVLQVGFIANAIIEGMQKAKAKSILGILDNPTLGQRALAAACNGINEAIPGIGGIIPTETLFSIVFTVLQTLGLDTGKLGEQRAEAKAVVEAYNDENGTTYNVEEYIHNVLNESTIQDKIKEKASELNPFKKFFKKNDDEDEEKEYDTSESDANYEKLNQEAQTVTDSTSNKRGDGISSRNGFGSAGNSKIFSGVRDSVKTKGYVSKYIASGSGLIGGASITKNVNKNNKTESASNTVSSFIRKQSNTIPNVDNMVKDLWKFTDPKKTSMSNFNSTLNKYKSSGNTLGNTIVETIGGTMKMYDSLIRSINTLNTKVKSASSSFSTSSGTSSSSSGTISKTGSFWSWVKDTITGNSDNSDQSNYIINDKETSTTSTEDTTETESESTDTTTTDTSSQEIGGNSKIHTKQTGNYRKFGNSTINDIGCGPAVASTVLKSYGKNIGINEAASYAEKKGYVAGKSGVRKGNKSKFRNKIGGKSSIDTSGTRAEYFDDILGQNGIDTKYESNPNTIRQEVSRNKPTILLGQDTSNTSKKNSPFGPNPHYVVARGLDTNGNVVIDDPEMDTATTYKKNILKNARLGIVAGGASGVSGLVSDVLGSVFGEANNKLGTKASSILKYIVSDGLGEEEEETSTDADSDSSGSGGANFTPIPLGASTSNMDDYIPEKYRPLYNKNNTSGGLSDCYVNHASIADDKSKQKRYNSLPNCVSWAWARYSHIASEINGEVKWYSRVRGNPGKGLLNSLKSAGWETSTSTPKPGALIIWNGHIAVVESVLENGDIIRSESEYNGGRLLNTGTTTKASGYAYGSHGKAVGFAYNKYVKESSGSDSDGSANAPIIWNFLRGKGISAYGTAAIMGCWTCESSLIPKRIEYDSSSSFPGYDVVQNEDKMNEWSKYVINHTSSAVASGYKYKGKYYCGLGLAQWTASRNCALINYANEHGVKWYSLSTQLNFFWDEYGSGKLFDKVNKQTSLSNALQTFAPYETGSRRFNTSEYNPRYSAAQKIYQQYGNTAVSSSGSGSNLKDMEYKNNSYKTEYMMDTPSSREEKINGITKKHNTGKSSPYSINRSINRINKQTGGSSGVTSLSDTYGTTSSASSTYNTYDKEVTKTSLKALYENDSTLFKKMPNSVVEQICLNAANNPSGVNIDKIPPTVFEKISESTRNKLLLAGNKYENLTRKIKAFSSNKSSSSDQSALGSVSSNTTSGSTAYTSKFDQILTYMDQLVSNTANNANLPKLVEIVSEALDVLSGMNKNISSSNGVGVNSSSTSNSTTDSVNNTEREISLMKKKLEAIAQSL